MLMIIAALVASPAQGPMLGNLTPSSVRIWMRLDEPGQATINLYDPAGTKVWHTSVRAEADADNTAVASISALTPDTRYAYVIDGEHKPGWFFTTPPQHATHTRLAFASCAKEAEGSGRVWNRIDTLHPNGLVLLGDTPYIDSTNLDVQRRRYREFVAFAPFANLASHTAVYSTWDDHDFGLNDTDGRLDGKANSRRAVMEYRPNPSFGEDDKGIYTSFRSGPVEVFLLDARWFARTQGTEGDWSLLGAQQWAWLTRTLKASSAPFKVIATGMVFNGSVRPGKHDCWGAYRQEYDRLRALIDDMDGVVLVSGDVHWSRELEHDPGNRGDSKDWPLVEFVTSPVHEHLIAAADPPHPWLQWSRGEVNSFLVLDADEHTLRMSFMNAAGDVLHNRVLRLPHPRVMMK